MSSKTFRYTVFALRILEKILGSKFSVTGIEKLPKQPILFVANHFTRSETFFVPYLIYKYTGHQVRCLADSGLYHGVLGRFLESVGTISTKHKNRDNIILKDLISGEYNWMIYPEGSMVKSKETKNEHGYVNYTPYRIGPVRTGSAVLALRSEIYRQEIVSAFEEGNLKILQEFEQNFGLVYDKNFKDLKTCVVPLNINYYPIRPGQNSIQKLLVKLIKKIPQQIAEELEIEGNILLGAEINVNFGDPINLQDYIKSTNSLVSKIPIIKNETKMNFILRYYKNRLTNDFMAQVYSDIQVNLDHVFASAIRQIEEEKVSLDRLKRVIYLSAVMIEKTKRYRIHSSIAEENLFKIFIDEANEEFDGVFDLACKQGLIEKTSGGDLRINKAALTKKYDFHEIRRENTLQVIDNEFSLLEFANNIIKQTLKIADEDLCQKVFEEICKKDLKNFDNDYENYFDKNFSKDKSVGRPFFLSSDVKASKNIKQTGILISHGYKSAPKEVESLAKFLSGFGFNIYAVRLKGHGTAPVNLKDVSWNDWYYSMQRGYAALRNVCNKIIIVGFSTGGLLALNSAAQKKADAKLSAIVSINAALKLLDIRARMVAGINMWNELLNKIHVEKGLFEYVDDKPENPQINYSRNYLKGVEQLEKLMQNCEDNLEKIKIPALVIQGDKDPVVNPISGKMIYEKINSEKKFLQEMDFKNHVIVNGENKEEVFDVIKKFLVSL